MASKKKLNGDTSVDYIEGAGQKAGINLGQLFRFADFVAKSAAERKSAEELLEPFDPSREACLFIRFKNEGIAVHPNYKIPERVIAFAAMLHSAECPQTFCNDLRGKIQSRAMTLLARATMRPTTRTSASASVAA